MSIPPLSDYLDIYSVSPEQFWGLLRLARELKTERSRLGHNAPILADRSLAMLFQKPSLRTRVSFEMGMQHLGGHAFYITYSTLGHGATYPDTTYHGDHLAGFGGKGGYVGPDADGEDGKSSSPFNGGAAYGFNQ